MDTIKRKRNRSSSSSNEIGSIISPIHIEYSSSQSLSSQSLSSQSLSSQSLSSQSSTGGKKKPLKRYN